MTRSALLALMCVTVGLGARLCDAADRVALVIGNSNYEGQAALQNPSHDADAIATALEELGFSVMKEKDLDLAQMEDALVEFRRALGKGSLGFFFYAGHGLQVKGENFLVPIGARMREEFQVKRACIDVGQVLEAMAESESNLKVLILDCCRDNPFQRSWTRSSAATGLAPISNIPEGTLIAYSTSPGKTAADGTGDNSPYARHLAATLRSRPPTGLELRELFFEASRAVKRETGQVPWLTIDGSLPKYFLHQAGTEPLASSPSTASSTSTEDPHRTPDEGDDNGAVKTQDWVDVLNFMQARGLPFEVHVTNVSTRRDAALYIRQGWAGQVRLLPGEQKTFSIREGDGDFDVDDALREGDGDFLDLRGGEVMDDLFYFSGGKWERFYGQSRYNTHSEHHVRFDTLYRNGRWSWIHLFRAVDGTWLRGGL